MLTAATVFLDQPQAGWRGQMPLVLVHWPFTWPLLTILANTIFQIDTWLKTRSQDYLSRTRHNSLFQTHMQSIVFNRNSGSTCPLSEYSYSVEAHTASWMTQGNGNEEVSNALLKSLVRISCSLPDRTGFSSQPRTEQINQCHFPL